MGFNSPKFHHVLNGIYGGLPYIGNLIALGATVPLLNGLNGEWRGALGIWAVAFIVPFILWMIVAYPKREEGGIDTGKVDANLFKYVWKFRNIRSMTYVYCIGGLSPETCGSQRPDSEKRVRSAGGYAAEPVLYWNA